MTQEEELQAVREENRLLKVLVAELLPLREEVARLKEQVKHLEDRLARLPRATRRPSGKAPGGQPGHRGHTLMMVQTPDEIISHRPAVCRHCQRSLTGVAGELADRRQMLDLPEIRLLVQE